MPERHGQPGKLARLEQNMYGTQDAASIWSDPRAEKGSTRGRRASHVLRHIGVIRKVTRVVLRRRLLHEGHWRSSASCSRSIWKYGRQDTLARSLRVLNRTISINIELDAIVLEPDQCHVSKMVEDLGLADSKSMKTPRLKPDFEVHVQTEDSKTLGRRQQRSTEATPCALLTSLKTEWTYWNQCSASADTCKHHAKGHMVELKLLAIVADLWCSSDSRQGVHIPNCMWIHTGLETWHSDAAPRR